MSAARLTLHGLLALWLASPSVAWADDDSAKATQTSESALRPNDFAWGIPLQASQGSAVQTFVLPSSVLERCDSRRQQLSVFNAAGEVVPHAVRELASPTTEPRQTFPIPVFPLRGAADSAPNTQIPPLRVQVQQRADGTLTSIAIDAQPKRPSPEPDPSAGSSASISLGSATAAPVVAYVLDTSQLPRGIERLEFALSEHEPTFIWPLMVSTSSDLDHFASTSVRGSLASLSHAGHGVERRALSLAGLRAPYLRLTWAADKAPAVINGVSAVLTSATQPAPAEVREFEPSTTSITNQRDFDLGAALPLEALNLVLERNTVIDVEILGATAAATEPGTDFVRLYEGTFYHLEHAGDVVGSERVQIPRARYRTIRVRVEPKGGGLGSAKLRLAVHVVPEQLVFVARGNGPFTLAFGRAGTPPAAFDASELLGLLGASPSTLPRSTVVPGEFVPLGGDDALRVPKAINYKQISLWGVLLLAVGLLGALSLRLLRRVESNTDVD